MLSTSELVNTNSMFYIYFHWVFYICFCHINKLICILQNISMCPCTFFLYQTPCDKSDNDNVGLHNMYQVHILIMTCIATSSIGWDSFYKKKIHFCNSKGDVLSYRVGSKNMIHDAIQITNDDCDKCHSTLDFRYQIYNECYSNPQFFYLRILN